jgi:apolipoprotein N-acyltransferase
VRRRRGGVVIPSLAAGVGLALSLPPWGWWPLAFLGAGLLYWRLAGLPLRTRFLAGWVAGLGCFGIGLAWAQNFNWYGAVVLVVLEALSMGAAGALTTATRGRLVSFVGAFTLLEAGRMAWPFGGLPIGGVYLGQAGGPLLGVARLGGPLLLTAMVWALGAVVGSVGDTLVHRGRGRLARRSAEAAPASGPTGPGWATLAAAGIVVVISIVGALAPDGGPALRSISVAAVQGGGRRGLSKAEIPPAVVFSAALAATETLVAGGRRPALVLWPEDVIALPGPLAGTPQAADMAELARELGATIAAGVTETVSDTSFRNEIVAWGPNGHVVSVFEKVHRVPFGEYVPFRSFFAHLASLSAVPLDAIAGRGSGLLRTPAAPLGALVSYEVFFAGRGRSSVRAGAQLLIVPTNTASYATSQVPAQEIAAARVQAVEEGRDLVQAAPTGFSAVITQRGAIVRRSRLGERDVIVAEVALRDGATLYERFGDLPIEILAGLMVALGVLVGRRAPRSAGAHRWHDASSTLGCRGNAKRTGRER